MTESQALIQARALSATAQQGTIFGPLDLTVEAGDLVIVHGARGSGKSALLLALAGRFRPLSGSLYINGIDAIADPYAAIVHSSVARLGNYVAPEDRLTISESIAERAYLDGISIAAAEDRANDIEQLLGYRVDRNVEIEQLDPLTRVVVSAGLAMLRPTSVVVIDDVDMVVPHSRQFEMFECLARLTELDGCAIITSAIDADTAPAGSIRIRLGHKAVPYVAAIHDTPVDIETVDADPDSPDDPDADQPVDETIITRTTSQHGS